LIAFFAPELRDERLDAASEGAHEDAVFLRQGRAREVAVAIDPGHPAVSAFGGLQ